MHGLQQAIDDGRAGRCGRTFRQACVVPEFCRDVQLPRWRRATILTDAP
jgi:hypothetical protein